jgi:hypothetical protein
MPPRPRKSPSLKLMEIKTAHFDAETLHQLGRRQALPVRMID